MLIMDRDKIEDRKDCAGEGQQQFSRPTDRSHKKSRE
jgi:hypothetical protein